MQQTASPAVAASKPTTLSPHFGEIQIKMRLENVIDPNNATKKETTKL